MKHKVCNDSASILDSKRTIQGDLTERDCYALLARAMAERSFEELAAEMGIRYKEIAAVCSRAVQKFIKQMEGAENEISKSTAVHQIRRARCHTYDFRNV